MRCPRISADRTCIRGFWKVFILLAVLLVVSQLVYVHFSKVYFQRDPRAYFNRITEKVQTSKVEEQTFLRLHGQKEYNTPNANASAKSHNGNSTMQLKNAKPFLVVQSNKPSTMTESPQAAIRLFQSLTHSPFRVLAGKTKDVKGRFTIGVPSARRPNTNAIYLTHTLDSIIRATTDDEKARTTIVVLLSDTNDTYKAEISQTIYRDFRPYCDEGFINVIELSPEVFPDLDHVRKTFNDARPRLKWRAKQNIDFAYLMYYCRDISDYYLQLEDDVIAASEFLKDIDEFIAKQTSQWFLLEFSYLGFIGKLFKSPDLMWTAKFLLSNYDLAPCDLQLGAMRKHHDQSKAIIVNTTLFQHIGKFSTLQDKLMPSIDIRFKEKSSVRVEVDDIPVGYYPPATTETNLEVYRNYIPSSAYDNNLTTFFWGKTPSKGDYFIIRFQKPQNASRILVLSGHPTLYHDRLSTSTLMVATVSGMDKDTCKTFSKIVALVDGQVDTLATDSKIPRDIMCLKIQFTVKSRTWAILREIRLVK